MAQRNLDERVRNVAGAILARQRFVSPVDVLVGLGWLAPSLLDRWRQGRVDALEDGLQVNPDKIAAALAVMQTWATERGLAPSQTDYLARSPDRRHLRFNHDGDPDVERTYRTHWVSPDLSDRAVKRQSSPPDLVVISPLKDWTCTGCGGTGALLIMAEPGPLCLDCADLGHLEFLPSGDAALTRRAKKGSRLSAVVMRWSRSRKRYERQGILAEPEAIEQAEQQCFSDAEVRARRQERDRERRGEEDVRFETELAAAIVSQFPGCPAERAVAIASHAAVRGSCRIGRSAAGRALHPDAVRLAVVASVRHLDTDYDDLLMSGVDRDAARDRVFDQVEDVLNGWRDAH